MFATPEWQVLNHKFVGGSLAGVGTSVGALDYGVCFDLANGPRHTLKFTDFLITHAHSDHISGLPYVVSQKAMGNARAPKFYVPEETVEGLTNIMNEWQKLEDYLMPYELIGLTPGQSVPLDDDFRAQTFRTVHRVPSLGYTIFAKKKKLKSEFAGKSQNEIIQLKRNGVTTDEFIETAEITFTGDTQIEVFEKHPEILNSRLLFFEVTYYDGAKSVAETKKWGHTHFDEMLPYLKRFKGEKIVFIHHSARYRGHEVANMVKSATGEYFEKIYLAPSLYSMRD